MAEPRPDSSCGRALAASPTGFFHLGPGGRVVCANRAGALFFASTPGDLAGNMFELMLPVDVRDAFRRAVAGAEQGDERRLSLRLPAGEGSLFVEMSLSQALDERSGPNGCLVWARERTRLSGLEQSLAGEIFANALEGIMVTDRENVIRKVNPAFTSITGYGPEDILGAKPSVLKSEHQDREFYRRMWEDINRHGRWQGEIVNRRKNGEAYAQWLNISRILGDKGELRGYVGVFHDLSELKRHQEMLRHQFYHDTLTSLPNRHLFSDRLSVALGHARRKGGGTAVLQLDVDNFKTVNDSLGHAAGDDLLKVLAGRLKSLVREGDTLARLGGDEFAVLIEDAAGERPVVETARRILASFDEPFRLKGHAIHLSGSVGIAMAPDDGNDPDTLLKNADTAMYRSKEGGKNAYSLFAPAMNERAFQRMALEGEIRRALARDDFEVWYQPRVRASDGRVVGMEALARWRSNGQVRIPKEFIPLSEETGLIVPLGRSVLVKALHAARRWSDMVPGGLSVSVNLSPRQFMSLDLASTVAEALDISGLDPARLELEITESAVMQDMDSTVKILDELVGLGVSVSVDDFGTGHSSLAYLKRFPLRALKVDASFVRDMAVDPNDAALVKAIILMGKSLGLKVTAEGVETREQLGLLRGNGCDELQGNYFSGPLPPEEFEAFLREAVGRSDSLS